MVSNIFCTLFYMKEKICHLDIASHLLPVLQYLSGISIAINPIKLHDPLLAAQLSYHKWFWCLQALLNFIPLYQQQTKCFLQISICLNKQSTKCNIPKFSLFFPPKVMEASPQYASSNTQNTIQGYFRYQCTKLLDIYRHYITEPCTESLWYFLFTNFPLNLLKMENQKKNVLSWPYQFLVSIHSKALKDKCKRKIKGRGDFVVA